MANFFELDTHGFEFLGRKHAGCEAKIRELNMTGRVDKEIFGLEVAMNVAELVESVYAAEHLGDVES